MNAQFTLPTHLYKIQYFRVTSRGLCFQQRTVRFNDMYEISFQYLLLAASIPTSFALLYVVLLIHYELFLSPLSSYPGPFLARITPVHNLYHAFKKDIHHDIWKQHEYYGNSHFVLPACR